MSWHARYSELAKALIFTLCFLLVNGYRLGIDGGNVAFLPAIEALSGESRLLEDFGVRSYLPYHPAFNQLLAAASQIAGIPALFLAGYLLSGALFYVAIASLVRRTCAGEGAVAIAAGLLLLWGSAGIEANSFWYSGQFAPYLASWPFALLAISCGLDGRPIATAILLGASASLHVQQGVDVAIALYAALLLTRRMSVRQIAVSSALFALSTWPACQAAYEIARGDLWGAAEMIEQASFRSPHHFELQPRKFQAIALAVALLAGSFPWLASARGAGLRVESWRVLVVLCLTIHLATSLHYIAFHATGWREVILLQFPRITSITQLVVVIACAALADSAMRRATRPALGWAVLFSLFVGPIWLATGYFSRPELLFCAAAGAFLYTDHARASGRDTSRAFLRTLAVLIALKAVFVSVSYDHYFVFDPREIEGDPWIDVSRWAARNTPEDALFVTPPSEEGFSFYSRRGAVADFVANPHLRSHTLEWRRRLADLSGGELPRCSGWSCLGELEKAYDGLGEEQIRSIAVRYGASYAVAKAGRYALPVLYDNGTYAIYVLRTRA